MKIRKRNRKKKPWKPKRIPKKKPKNIQSEQKKRLKKKRKELSPPASGMKSNEEI